MKKLVILLLLTTQILAQNFLLNGIVKDSLSKNVIPNVNVFIEELNIGTSSNASGTFRFNNIKKSKIILVISHIGYKSKKIQVELPIIKQIEILLEQFEIQLSETEINGVSPKFRQTPVPFS